jgi:hypothetical protein
MSPCRAAVFMSMLPNSKEQLQNIVRLLLVIMVQRRTHHKELDHTIPPLPTRFLLLHVYCFAPNDSFSLQGRLCCL